jgi:hypothetical protein
MFIVEFAMYLKLMFIVVFAMYLKLMFIVCYVFKTDVYSWVCYVFKTDVSTTQITREAAWVTADSANVTGNATVTLLSYSVCHTQLWMYITCGVNFISHLSKFSLSYE